MTKNHPQRIVLVNAWHDANTGDSAISQGCLELARRVWPDGRPCVHTMLGRRDPAYDSWCRLLRLRFTQVDFHPAPFPEPASGGRFRKISVAFRALQAMMLKGAPMLLPGYWEFRRHLKGAVALVVIGGSSIFEVAEIWSSRWRLRRITAPILIARSRGVPVYLWGHTIGPFESSEGRAIGSQALAATTAVVVRDEASATLVTALAPHAKARVAPDLGFFFAPVATETRYCAGRYIVLVPRRHLFDVTGQRTGRLLGELATFAQGVLDRGEVERVYVVPQVSGPSWVEDDRTVVDELVRRISRDSAESFKSEVSPTILIDLYRHAQAVVTVRLHSAIFSIAAGTPAFAISYFTGKTKGVMTIAGQPGSWAEFDEVTGALIGSWWRGTEKAGQSAALLEATERMRAEILDSIYSSVDEEIDA